MSTSVRGVRDLDGEFAKMMAVKLACEAARVAYPQAVTDYFKTPWESEDYLRREMESIDISSAVTKYERDATDGLLIDLAKLPSGVKAIRFETSY